MNRGILARTLGAVLWCAMCWVPASAQSLEPLALVDYQDFPQDWRIRGDAERVRDVYQVERKGDEWILSAAVSGEPIRIFKKVSWNPYTHPILTWKWRVLEWPAGSTASIDFYVSLDRDILGIPTMVKYLWSADLPLGLREQGGFFSPPEVVIRSGPGAPEEWVTERINVLEDFRRLNQSDPSRGAVGVGLLVSKGVRMEISEIVALPRR